MKTEVTFHYILASLLAVLATWLLHESAHWIAGELLGYNMALSLNSSFPLEGSYASTWHANLVSAAGPALTLGQAVVVFFLLARRPATNLFPFLFTAFYMRLLASGMNLINLNDEGRISYNLGLGTFTIPLIISTILLILTLMIAKKWAYSRKFIIWTTILVVLWSSVLILSDQFYQIRIF